MSKNTKNTNTTKTADIVALGLAKRHRKEKLFRIYGVACSCLCVVFLLIFLGAIVKTGYKTFWETKIKLDIFVDPNLVLALNLQQSDYETLVKKSIYEKFPQVVDKRDKRELVKLLSDRAPEEIKDFLAKDPSHIGDNISLWLSASSKIDMVYNWEIDLDKAVKSGVITQNQASWLEELKRQNCIKKAFNWSFFSKGDSHDPSSAGIGAALKGSFYLIVVAVLVSFPLGLAAAIYLEEFAPRNRITDIVEININNLASVPSVIFGIIGLAVFLNFFQLPRSSPLVGGLVLALMTMPVIIITSRGAIEAVPPSIKEAALGVGASRVQAVFHHVIPVAFPGIITGVILGTARALGETAPLLLVGMVAFIADIPSNILEPASALPVQIFLWSDQPEQAFVARTAGAIMVLLIFMIIMNGLAFILRGKYERRWKV